MKQQCTAVSDAEKGKLSLSIALLIQAARVGEGWDMIPQGTMAAIFGAGLVSHCPKLLF